MQEQLQRIRNNDYSHLDDKLYSNMGITSDLDNTISQLAELQRYLKSQIDGIQDSAQKQAALKASQVVMKMQSFTHQQAYFKKCHCIFTFNQVLDKVKKIKKAFKNIRDNIAREIRDCVNDITQNINENLLYLVGVSTRKNNENTKLKNQIYIFQQQLTQLKSKKQQLELKVVQFNQSMKKKKQKEKERPEKFYKNQGSIVSYYMNTEHHLTSRDSNQQYFESVNSDFQKIIQQSGKSTRQSNKVLATISYSSGNEMHINNQTPRLPMPLRKDSSLRKYGNSLQKYGSCINTNQKQKLVEESYRVMTTKNSPVNVKQNLKQQLLASMHTNNREKENEIKMKGIEGNRKSTKKLKLFSMI